MKFKNMENRPLKILIYGQDGTGKTYTAVKYCRDHQLKPVLIDVEDTCHEDVPVVDIKQNNHLTITKGIVDTIKEIESSTEYDTLILDGVSTLLEELVSSDYGWKAYKARNDNFGQILKALRKTGINIIFIGQEDMRVIVSDEYTSNKIIIKINAMVNKKFYCSRDVHSGSFRVNIEKDRGHKE